MPLTHVPSHTVSYPDRFENEDTGYGYSVHQDTNAEDPRTWFNDEHAAVYVYRGPRGDHEEVLGNIAARAFQRFWNEDPNGNDARALERTQRWLRIFHPDEKISCAILTIRGYSQSDWADVFAAVQDGYGSPDSHITQYRMWAYGDVWTVIPDLGVGISAIYADDAETALEQFRRTYEYTNPFAPGNDETLVPQPLDPFEHADPFRVRWEIDSDKDISPARAAANAWTQNFNRGVEQPSPDDACVFTVTDMKTGAHLTIDLSDTEYAGLFD